MSEWLTASVPPKLAYHYLDEIDEQCDNLGGGLQPVCINRGPFSVFRLTQQASCQPRPESDFDTQQEPPDQEPDQAPNQVPNQEADQEAELPQDVLELLFYDDTFLTADNARQLSPATTLALTNMGFGQSELARSVVDPSRIVEIFDGDSIDALPAFSLPMETPSSTYHFPGFQSAPSPQSRRFLSPNPVSSSLMSVSSTVPANAVFLLSHYSTTVIKLLTPFRHTKTPWHILFIPHVKSCLAAIAMGEKLDHASLCTFYGTLALSAFSMRGLSQSDSWLDEGKAYREQARQHALMMLSTAYNVPKVAKYKSILMALITMVQLSFLAGHKEQTEHYFLEAEKFIRLRGLHRRKSRKVRLLHHCYVFERLFYESTSVASADSEQRSNVIRAVESAGILVHGQDSASFRLPDFDDLDTEMQRAKDQEEGENDLHLERIGDFPGTLYPEVFGVPEIYMLLLSLVIRLGKEKDGIDKFGRTTTPKDFMAQAKAVERSILRMHPARYKSIIAGSVKPHDNGEVIENMLTAIHHALAIYFYRRMYDLDASLLQQRVVAVRDCLQRCERADPDAVCGSAGFIWPAFIAACEAEEADVQDSFADMFTKLAQKSGLSTFADTLTDIRQVWSAKRNADVTWLDVMRRKQSRSVVNNV